MRIVGIGDVDTILIFKFAGIKDVFVIKNEKEAEQLLTKLGGERDIAIILLQESFMYKLSEFIGKLTRDRELPCIIPIPDRAREVAPKVDLVERLVRQTVGVPVKVE